MPLTWYFIEVLLGAVLLAWSASRFIDASVQLARLFKWPPLVIGLVFVGLGTSFPELVVSVFASVRGSGDLAVGNVVGSNIANLSLVLGSAALLTPLTAHLRLIRRELPILILVSLLLGVVFVSSYLSRWEGGLLVVAFFAYLYFILRVKPSKKGKPVEQAPSAASSLRAGLSWWFLGLVLLLGSSELFVSGALDIARWFKMSELVIGLTIVTIGTSLPELAATIVSAFKNQHDIAIGHVIGSNIFNSLIVLAMPALIAPGWISPRLIRRDYPVMLGFTALMWATLFFTRTKQVGRLFGGLLISAYILYIFALFAL